MRQLSLLFLFACKGATPLLTDDPVEPPACDTLDEAACNGATHCAPIEGFAVGNPMTTGLCRDPAALPVHLGCQDALQVCPPAELTVQDPRTGDAFLVPTGCMPQGYGVIDEAIPTCQDCASTPLDQCEELEACALITGRPGLLQPDRPVCLPLDSEPVELACVDASLSCDDVVTWASATEGSLVHRFPDSCVPEGWVTAGPVDVCTCGDFDLDRCPTDCGRIYARPLHANTCVDFSEDLRPIACGETGGCGDAESYAADPTNGAYWWFPSTCTPQGWGTVPGTSYPACDP